MKRTESHQSPFLSTLCRSKKLHLVLIGLFVFTFSASALPIRWGVEVGWDIQPTKLRTQYLDVQHRVGWFVGPRASLNFGGSPLSLDASVLYNQRRLSVDAQTSTDTWSTNRERLSYLVFPVSLRVRMPIGGICKVYGTTGPQWRRYIEKNRNLRFGDDAVMRVDPGTMSWNIGLGLDLLSHLQFAITYNIAFDQNYSLSEVNSTLREFKSGRHTCQFRIQCEF